MGGSLLEHDCCTSRSIGYYLEPLAILGLFGKKVGAWGAWLEGIGVSCLHGSECMVFRIMGRESQADFSERHCSPQTTTHPALPQLPPFALPLTLPFPAILCYPPQPLSITLRGITNDSGDPGVDVFRTVTLPLLVRGVR